MRYLLLSLILVKALSAFPQASLSDGVQYSPYTYIYKINVREAELLVRSGLYKVSDKFLHSLIDSFRTHTPGPKLSAGNYLLMNVQKNQQVFELYTTGDVSAKLVSNDRHVSVAVHDGRGRLIEKAKVHSGKQLLAFNANTRTYGPAKPGKLRRRDFIKVEHNSVLYTFPVSPYRAERRPLISRIAYSFPLKYLVVPIRRIFVKEDHYREFFNDETSHEKKFKGFIAFNKPIYKPGDTLRLKAFVQTNKGRRLNTPLILRIADRALDTDTVIATIRPYRPGGYEYSFVLSDSLDLTLDEQYLITLETPRSKKYNLDNYQGNLEDDEYAMKRKVLVRGKFEYEDYELDAITFTARSNRSEHHRGEELALFMKATDENEMAVMDGRVEIIILANENPQFRAPTAFLPDTLWVHEQALENIGETKIVVPESIFPKANFTYRIQCNFLNTNNEMQSQTLAQSFIDDSRDITFDLQLDSLFIEQKIWGRSVNTDAVLYVFRDNDTVERRNIMMPAAIKLNPFATSYEVVGEDIKETFKLPATAGQVSCRALRTSDSVVVSLVNPLRLPVWYTVFAGKKIVLRGYGDTLLYQARTITPKNYFVSLQYVFAGTVRSENYTIPFQDKLLSINVKQPDVVYPGQTAKVEIDVSDHKGRPVKDADVTAYAYTRKFQTNGLYVPYMGRRYPLRKKNPGMFHVPPQIDEHAIRLNWERWGRELNLDTMEYYKFMHPRGMYRKSEPAKDSITQIAPFVVSKGEFEPIHLIYIDEKPVFFSKAQHLQRYSFEVPEGRHSLRIRTHNRLIWVDSVMARKGMKNFFSISLDTPGYNVRVDAAPDSLTRYEQELWNRYMILVENNFGENFAYVQQGNNVFMLSGDRNSRTLIGPLSEQFSKLVVKDKFEQSFFPEGQWHYNIEKGLIKQKQAADPRLFFSSLSRNAPSYNFRDYVLTAPEIDSIWQDYLDLRSSHTELFHNTRLSRNGNGGLMIGLSTKPAGNVFIKNVIVFRYDNPDFIRVFMGSTRNLGYFEPGKYRILFLLKNNDYFIRDSITVKQNGISYYEITPEPVRMRDSVSLGIIKIIEGRTSAMRYDVSDLDLIKMLFNNRYIDRSAFSENVTGIVHDGEGRPVTGAVVAIKGTNFGTVTNQQGEYSLRVPAQATLVISSVGFDSREVRIYSNIRRYDVELRMASYSLNEVVVVGYAAVRKRSMSLAFSSTVVGSDLQGKLAGVMIRGQSTLTQDANPLIIVDGVPYHGDLNDLDKETIAAIKTVPGVEAEALWGSRAAGGLIVITTKKQSSAGEFDQPMPANSIRRNFRDYAYWQPRLTTDASGKASFNVTYPDDITNWRGYVIAMGDKKQTGYAETFVKSFKALSGNVMLPQFAVEGDSINVIGKTLNYLQDTIRVKRIFSVNDRPFKENIINIRNSWIDTFAIVAAPRDSLKLKYTIQKDDGYADGEERSIPVFRAGTMETNGFFAALNKDTTFEVSVKADTGNVKVYAESSLLPVWYSEAESIRNYEYLCNEQLASKLRALLVQKKIDEYYKRPFRGERNIRDLLTKLSQTKSVSGLWDWWKGDNATMWISLHVLEALLDAGADGYTININKTALTDYLIFNLENYKGTEKISCLFLLHRLGAKADFQKYIDALEDERLPRSLYERLRIIELQQLTGLPVRLDSLIARKSNTAFGNVYWGEDNYLFFDNSIQNTLAMYRILKTAGGHEDLLSGIRNYFLEKRKSGSWRNTYESSLILKTILPDLLAADPLSNPATITIKGSENITVQKFPFYTELKSGEKISVSKQGAMPIYFTAYEQHWNKAPDRLDGNFLVHSSFVRTNEPLARLKAGVPVTLRVNVTVKADADYVMIEIPIPAGCSYQSKEQSWRYGEVHREYFKNKVSIFSRTLPKGQYEFTVSLLPRFSGVYSLNPAKAEMMYFPVFNGREGMKKVEIK